MIPDGAFVPPTCIVVFKRSIGAVKDLDTIPEILPEINYMIPLDNLFLSFSFSVSFISSIG
jgi:hypothetical protein